MNKFRIVRWYKQFRKNVSDSIYPLMLNVKDLYVESKRVKKFVIKYWILPLMDIYKFNIDGSARGNPGTMDLNSAEILTIKKVGELCQSNPSLRGRVISIVSDLK
ncbi:hypothetical protein Ddye_019250, partial [Dipteronia dyeriana]